MCKCGKGDLVVTSLNDLREKKVFDIILKGPSSFTLIKNEAGFHQEITSRVLARLMDKFVVRKIDNAYDLCCNASNIKQSREVA